MVNRLSHRRPVAPPAAQQATQQQATQQSVPARIKAAYDNPVIRIAASAALLYAGIAGLRYCRNEGAFNDNVIVPVVEEVIFREGVHSVMKVAQFFISKCRRTPAQESAQLVQRVLVSSALFALVHTEGLFCQFWLLGRATGYLYEATNSVALPILLHSAHNVIDMLCHPIPLLYLPFHLVLHGTVLWKLGKRVNPFAAFADLFRSQSLPAQPVATS